MLALYGLSVSRRVSFARVGGDGGDGSRRGEERRGAVKREKMGNLHSA